MIDKNSWRIINGDALSILSSFDDNTVNCCVTSPPYWALRNYEADDQVGLESSPDLYVKKLADVFDQVRRVLKEDGTCWVNIGDSYYGPTVLRNVNGHSKRSKNDGGLKNKDLCGIPWRLALELQKRGWYLRADIIWEKPNCLPQKVKDRPTISHEYLFLLAKNSHYYYDTDSIREQNLTNVSSNTSATKASAEGLANGLLLNRNGMGTSTLRKVNPLGRNKRSVWTISTQHSTVEHCAVMPENLVKPCILAGCPENGIVLDPFAGSGTTGVVALLNNRNFIGIELNSDYVAMATSRIADRSTLEIDNSYLENNRKL